MLCFIVTSAGEGEEEGQQEIKQCIMGVGVATRLR